MRLLGWVWSNYPIPGHMRIELKPGDLNVGVDLLSKWYDVERGKKTTNLDLVMTITPTD